MCHLNSKPPNKQECSHRSLRQNWNHACQREKGLHSKDCQHRDPRMNMQLQNQLKRVRNNACDPQPCPHGKFCQTILLSCLYFNMAVMAENTSFKGYIATSSGRNTHAFCQHGGPPRLNQNSDGSLRGHCNLVPFNMSEEGMNALYAATPILTKTAATPFDQVKH